MDDEDVAVSNTNNGDDIIVSSEEEIETPTSPPPKLPNLTNFFIEQNKHKYFDSGHSAAEINNLLKIEWKEKLGKKEKQIYKRQHKELKRKFDRLLKKYLAANPEFDATAYYGEQKEVSKTKKKKNNVTGQKRNRSSKKNQNNFSMQTFSDDDDNYNNNNNNNYAYYHNDEFNQPRPKKRRLSNENSSQLIDKLLSDMNGGKKRRPKEDNFTAEKEDLAKMTSLVESMRRAAQLDWQCNREKKPAIHTLKMLDRVITELSKKLFYKDFIEQCDVLEAIRDWIHPLPDGSLPPLKIRTEMYRIISKFQLHFNESLGSNLIESEHKTHEQKSEYHPSLHGFGKTLMNLWANKNETAENKAILRKTMEKWIRTLTQANVTYSEMREEQMHQTKNDIIRRNKILSKQSLHFNVGNSKRAKIPEKPGFDFTIQPRSNVDETESEQRGQRRNATHSKIDETFRSLRRNYAKQASRPSVTGRTTRM